MTFLQLDGLSKNYGGFAAVNAVTFDVARGEFLSLLGPSGCGKTTTLQMVAGFVNPPHPARCSPVAVRCYCWWRPNMSTWAYRSGP